MEIKKGDLINFRLSPDSQPYAATVAEFEDDLITLNLEKGYPEDINKSSSIIITYNNKDFRADIVSCSSGMLRAAILWSDVREYFRVDDFIQIIANKVEDTGACMRSRIFSGWTLDVSDKLTPDDTISPVLWRMLLDIHSKLNLILERLDPDSQSLMKVESRSVNISAAGISLVMDEKVEKGDLVEVKMILPNIPPVGIATFGRVVRATDDRCGRYKVALSFSDVEDYIKDEIIQYTLKRQREILKMQRMKEHYD